MTDRAAITSPGLGLASIWVIPRHKDHSAQMQPAEATGLADAREQQTGDSNCRGQQPEASSADKAGGCLQHVDGATGPAPHTTCTHII